jgi:hypothetical protein
VPRLIKKHYNVVYKEFDGEHIIPADVSEQAVKWFLNDPL